MTIGGALSDLDKEKWCDYPKPHSKLNTRKY